MPIVEKTTETQGKLGLLLYEKSLILYLMIARTDWRCISYGSRSKNFIFTRRTGETGNT